MTFPEIPPPPADGAAGRTERQSAAAPGTATGTALALLAAVVVAAVACLSAVYTAPESVRVPVAWGSGAAGLVLCVTVAVAAHSVLTARALRTRLAAQDAQAAGREAADGHFAADVVPAVIARLRAGGSAETALAEAPPVATEAQRKVLVTLATEVHRGESMRAAAMSACANAAGRVQALATSMAADLREMEHRHADEDVLGDLLHLDHRTAQTGRIADSIAVLTGARSGRRWAKPIVMESILRGAMGRISGYQRVRLHSASTVAIAGHAAEGVMHTLAELMDNAANFSPPTSEVHVYVEEVAAGAVITIEDGGLVMGEVALRRAQQAVSAEHGDLTTLSGTRLGLAVVGRLARKHGLSVSFRPSAHGGTGVLVRIPRELITEPRTEEPTAPAPAQAAARPAADARNPARGAPRAVATAGAAPRPTALPPSQEQEEEPGPRPGKPARTEVSGMDGNGDGDPGSGREHAAAPPPPEFGESGLPKRRRGQTLAAVARSESTAARSASSEASSPSGASSPDDPDPDSATSPDSPGAPGGPTRPRRPSGARFGDFRRAVQGGSPSEETSRTSSAPASSPARSSPLPEDDTE
ncbi:MULTISPECIES: ATP-binding protein [unclassified Streptomyces]|uniref:sensor histidine kinase n=1 Tax=unclassified Streptomyces TaxID=2593676 RepID=UPI002DDC3675|nr:MULTISPECIES: ATP-binding protein [unclassified Streptomyces]WSA91102.1 ATP-binding protein [Streptomyces sp. NBC_01795]WSS16290.1 ATP-binding protein [Streptomyces sp. NBC_01186]WSS45108.1 ATP-binding protein [Streptomyces sp. NBC_01187]